MSEVIGLYSYLDEQFPKSLSCEWDNDGIMCMPVPSKKVGKVLLSLDITRDCVAYAAKNGFDVIVSHHPLIFRPIKEINPAFAVSEHIINLIKNDIAAFSFHTRLDAVCGGVTDTLADIVGLSDRQRFGPCGEEDGVIGFIEKTTVSELAEKLKKMLNADKVSYTRCSDTSEKIAVVGGSGKDFVSSAIANGADTLITGEIPYNNIIEASDKGLNIICAGHYYTENPILSKLEEHIKKFDNTIYCEKFSSNVIIDI